MKIPKEYQQLCRDLAKVLRKFNTENGWMEKDMSKEKTIYRFHGKMSISDIGMSDVYFDWESGRHGDSERKISIHTEIRVNTEIDERE